MQDTKQPRQYPNTILDKFKVPQRIVHSTAYDAQRKKIVIWEEMYPSSRAKNGLFVIKNRASFEKRAQTEISRRRNEPTTGWELSMTSRTRGRGGQEIKFFLKHADFQSLVPVDFQTYEALIGECHIEQGVIKDELVFTSLGLMHAEKAKELEKEVQERLVELQVAKDSIKKDKLTRRTIRTGDVVAVHNKLDSSRAIYLGDADGTAGRTSIFAAMSARGFEVIRSAYARSTNGLAHPMYNAIRTKCTSLIYRSGTRTATTVNGPAVNEQYTIDERRSSYVIRRKKTFGPFWKLQEHDPLNGCNIIKEMLYEGTSAEDIQKLFKVFLIPSSDYTRVDKVQREAALAGTSECVGLLETIEQFQEELRKEKENIDGTSETTIS